MPKLVKTTLTSKLSSILERDIRSGKYVAGRRMPSTREIAGDFGVSQQVVKSAFAELESRKLVLSCERDGVYVNPAMLASSHLEFSLLAIRSGLPIYLEKVLSLGNAKIWDGINLSTRYLSQRMFNKALLCYELEKIKDAKPDCLLAFSASLPKELLEHFAISAFPSIFLGDFKWMPEPGAKINQVVEDTDERAETFIDIAKQSGASSAMLVGGTLDNCFNVQLKAAAERRAAKHGMQFSYGELYSARSYESQEAMIEVRTEFISRVLSSAKRPDAIILDGFIFIDSFLDAIRACGLEPGRDIMIVTDGEPAANCVYVESDYSEFSKAFISLAKELVAEPDKFLGRKILHGLIKRHPVTMNISHMALKPAS